MCWLPLRVFFITAFNRFIRRVLRLQTREKNAKQGKRASTYNIKKKNAKSHLEIEMKHMPHSEKETSNLLGLYIYFELINVMIICYMQ